MMEDVRMIVQNLSNKLAPHHEGTEMVREQDMAPKGEEKGLNKRQVAVRPLTGIEYDYFTRSALKQAFLIS